MEYEEKETLKTLAAGLMALIASGSDEHSAFSPKYPDRFRGDLNKTIYKECAKLVPVLLARLEAEKPPPSILP